MKIKTAILLLCFATASLIAGDNLLDSFNAKSDGKNITIEWKSADESSVSRYELERTNSANNFTYLTSQDAKGSYYSYKYVDEEAFMKDDNTGTQNKSIYTYRLKIVKKDNSVSYSNNVTVTHNVSGIRRTWGMIKEMFR
ncbi:MAG: hypothetical protein A2X61_13130 [Ignavibacteria bacterium GWB2_35_12]|nr:MAG: hypothetical protein A2X61_13130 [Ignavibacteria bacterium GWB2_35_12]